MGVTTESIYANSPNLSVGALTWVDMQNYRDPPPYPGHSKQVFTNQPGFRQSFSGSETSTDVSLSSTENLATSQRQEPQGEETQSPFYHHHQQQQYQHQQQQQYHQYHQQYNHQHVDSGDGSSSYSILARLGMPPGGLVEPSAGKGFGFSLQQQQHQHQGQGQSLSSTTNQLQHQQHPQNHNQQQHYHHLVTNSATIGSSIGDNSRLYSGGVGDSGSTGGGGGCYQHNQQHMHHHHHHQHQHHSLGNISMGGGGGGGGGHYKDTSVSTTPSSSSSDNNNTAAMGIVGADPSLYSHQQHHRGQHLPVGVPQWTVSDTGGGGSRSCSQYSHHSSSSPVSSSLSSSSSSFSTSSSSNKLINSSSLGIGAGTTLPGRKSSLSTATTTVATTLSSSSSSPSSTDTISTTSTTLPHPHPMADYACNKAPPPPSHPYLSPRVPPVSTYHHPHPYVNAHYSDSTGSGGGGLDDGSGDAYTNSTTTSRVSIGGVGALSSSASTTPTPISCNTSNTGDNNSSNNNNNSCKTNNYNNNLQLQRGMGGVMSGSQNTVSIPPTSFSSPSPHNQRHQQLPPPPGYPGKSNTDHHHHQQQHHQLSTTIASSSLSSSSSSFLSTTTTATTSSAFNDNSNSNIRTCRSYETIVADKMDKLLQMDAATTSSNRATSHHLLPNTNLHHHLSDIHRLCASSPGIYVTPHHARSPVRSTNTSSDDGNASGDQALSQASVAAKATQMVDVLTDENRALREELATITLKVSRLSKFEMEVHKMHEAHESLLQSHQRREALWLAMRRKLEERIRTLEEAGGGGSTGDGTECGKPESELRAKLADKESLVNRLLTQNQELLSSRKQVESENIQLNMTLAEQRAHVAIVEKALVNCQAKVLMRDDEYQKKISCENVPSASSSSSLTATAANETADDGSQPQEMEGSLANWNIGHLQKDLSCLKQTYGKESTLCLSDSSQPIKEVRLAALEKNSSEVEKLIEESKTEKLKHMEELHESNKKIAELEAKVRQLQTQLVEKEAMVKVFQRRSPYSLLPRSSSLHALCHHSPLHSPRPSLIASQALEGTDPETATTAMTTTATSVLMSSSGGGGGGMHREFSSIRHMKTGSTSAIDMGRKMSIEEDLLTRVQNLNSETKDDSTEEVRLWHV